MYIYGNAHSDSPVLSPALLVFKALSHDSGGLKCNLSLRLMQTDPRQALVLRLHGHAQGGDMWDMCNAPKHHQALTWLPVCQATAKIIDASSMPCRTGDKQHVNQSLTLRNYRFGDDNWQTCTCTDQHHPQSQTVSAKTQNVSVTNAKLGLVAVDRGVTTTYIIKFNHFDTSSYESLHGVYILVGKKRRDTTDPRATSLGRFKRLCVTR